MIPPVASDPDPTTQITWPSARKRGPDYDDILEEEDGLIATNAREGQSSSSAKPADGKQQLSTWNMITLSISMAGAQIAWTVELG